MAEKYEQDAFVVKLDLDALAVNKNMVQSAAFRQWRFQYQTLEYYAAPEPRAFSANDNKWESGVYLHWVFPRAMRSGDGASGAYPYLPNRWLITRRCKRNPSLSRSWVLESDCPAGKAGDDEYSIKNSPYFVSDDVLACWAACGDPRRKAAKGNYQNLGVCFPVENWRERSPDVKLFLTANAPANPGFLGYIGFNQGMFSFLDKLEAVGSDEISYSVIGWYANPGEDLLNTAHNEQVLSKLSWTVAHNAAYYDARRCYFTGAVYSLMWSPDRPLPDDPLDTISRKISLSVGHNATEAFSALVRRAIPGVFFDRITALFYDMLYSLDKVDGEVLFQNKIHQARFSSKSGGFRWVIRAKKDANKQTKLTANERKWLVQLNRDQYRLDKAKEKLRSLQWELNAAWWKKNRFSKLSRLESSMTGVTEAMFEQLFDTGDKNSLISSVIAQECYVEELSAEVPCIETADNQSGDRTARTIAQFAAAKGLSEDKELTVIAAPRYWKSGNPAVLVLGAHPPSDMAASKAADSDNVVYLLSQIKNVITIKQEEFAALPPPVRTLLGAFSWTDAGEEAFDGPKKVWSQSWSPLYMEWTVKYYDIPFCDKEGRFNWLFDGFDYYLSPDAVINPKGVLCDGITMLSLHTKNLLTSRLQELAALESGMQTNSIQADVKKISGRIDNWGILTQELFGLNEQLSQRDVRTFRRPHTERIGTRLLSELCGYANGAVEHFPYVGTEKVDDFDFIRSGQFYISDLILYDKFGRVLELLSSKEQSGALSAKTFPVITSPDLTPARRLVPGVSCPMQLKPRIMQYARLNLDLVDQNNSTEHYGKSENCKPVCGWLVANHLNHSIALYAASGERLGQLAVYQKTAHLRVVAWTPPAHSTLNSLDDVAALAPHIKLFIDDICRKDESGFTALLRVIDHTLWTIDPFADTDANLSVIMGKPLVLLRCALSLELDGEPVKEGGWKASFSDQKPAFYHYPFPVRLGDQSMRRDGLIGYFVGDQYTVFHSVVPPDSDSGSGSGSGDIRVIGNGNYLPLSFSGQDCVISMLADPRGQIHAYSGILPVKTLDIPDALVKDALACIESTFQIGPLVTRILPSQQPEDETVRIPPQSVQLPALAEQNGKWRWYEKSANAANAANAANSADGADAANGADAALASWSEYGIEPPMQGGQEAPTVREGILQFEASFIESI